MGVVQTITVLPICPALILLHLNSRPPSPFAGLGRLPPPLPSLPSSSHSLVPLTSLQLSRGLQATTQQLRGSTLSHSSLEQRLTGLALRPSISPPPSHPTTQPAPRGWVTSSMPLDLTTPRSLLPFTSSATTPATTSDGGSRAHPAPPPSTGRRAIALKLTEHVLQQIQSVLQSLGVEGSKGSIKIDLGTQPVRLSRSRTRRAGAAGQYRVAAAGYHPPQS